MKQRKILAMFILVIPLGAAMLAFDIKRSADYLENVETPNYMHVTSEQIAATALTRGELATSLATAMEKEHNLAELRRQTSRTSNLLLMVLVGLISGLAIALSVVVWRSPQK